MIDSCREASPDGEAEGHSDHRSQSGCSPRSLVEKGRRNGIIGAPGEMGDEIDALRVDGAALAPHVLIAMMMRRILGPMSPYWLRRE